jgi:hypothetical protein
VTYRPGVANPADPLILFAKEVFSRAALCSSLKDTAEKSEKIKKRGRINAFLRDY